MIKKVAIIIPLYKEKLNEYELIALAQCKKILHSHPIIAVKPTELVMPNEVIDVVGNNIETFDSHFFKDIQGYNQLMLSATFYERFLNYEYILIYQLDCFVFKDELNTWCNQKWDYIGAPWIKKIYHKNKLELAFSRIRDYFIEKFSQIDPNKPHQLHLKNKVGNGGFSLRKVKIFYDICLSMQSEINIYLSHPSNLYNEDVFWSLEVNRKQKLLNIPDGNTAINFAFEVPPFKPEKLTQANTPFGCHDWDHYLDFWSPIFKRHGYKI